MHPRVTEVINYLDTERDALRQAVESIPSDLRDRQPDTDRWSVAQVLHHLSIIEKRVGLGMAKWITDARDKGLGPETEASSILNSLPLDLIADRTKRRNAPDEVRPTGEVDAKTAWEQLEQARAALREAFIAGDGLNLGQVIQPHPVLGPINLYQWMLFVGSHEVRHTGQIVEIGEQFRKGATAAPAAG